MTFFDCGDIFFSAQVKVSGCRRHRLASKPLKKNLKLSQEIKNETRLEHLFHLVLFSPQANYVLEIDDGLLMMMIAAQLQKLIQQTWRHKFESD